MLEWKKIRRHRHATAEGRAICGIFGGYTDEPAPPCEACLKVLFTTLAGAFPDEPAIAEAG